MYKTIIVPVDIGNMERVPSMIDAARKLGGDDAKIVLTSIVERLPSYVSAEIPEGYHHRAEEIATEELNKIKSDTGLKADIAIRTGYPSRGILDVADETGADVIVIASHRPGLEDYFIGSTASKVVRHAKCSVMVIR